MLDLLCRAPSPNSVRMAADLIQQQPVAKTAGPCSSVTRISRTRSSKSCRACRPGVRRARSAQMCGAVSRQAHALICEAQAGGTLTPGAVESRRTAQLAAAGPLSRAPLSLGLSTHATWRICQVEFSLTSRADAVYSIHTTPDSWSALVRGELEFGDLRPQWWMKRFVSDSDCRCGTHTACSGAFRLPDLTCCGCEPESLCWLRSSA